MEPRFVVRGVTGYSMEPGTSRPATSYSVLDTVYCFREVGRFYANPGGGREASEKRRLRAERFAAELNAQDALELAADL